MSARFEKAESESRAVKRKMKKERVECVSERVSWYKREML